MMKATLFLKTGNYMQMPQTMTIVLLALAPWIVDEHTGMILFIVQSPKEPRKAK